MPEASGWTRPLEAGSQGLPLGVESGGVLVVGVWGEGGAGESRHGWLLAGLYT